MNREFRIGAADSPSDSNAVPVPFQDFEKVALLSEEIAILCDTLRSAIVLCEIDRVVLTEAAKQLGIAEETLSNRLSEAREQLKNRLSKRGVTLSANLFEELADSSHPAMPANLKKLTGEIRPGLVRSTVSDIAEDVMRSITFENKIKGGTN